MSLSPSAVRKAAAVRLALAACVGGGLLVLGMSQGPLSWLAPKPESAFALADSEKPEPYLAQPATPAQLAQMNRAASLPSRGSEFPKRAPAAASQLAAADEAVVAAPAKPVLTQTVRSQADFPQSARYSQAASAHRHEVAATRPNREVADSEPPVPARTQMELASFMDLKAAPAAAKSHSSQAAAPVPTRPAVNVLTVSPRGKSAPTQPSEAELGLKNPW
jgi:hypothetical protein